MSLKKLKILSKESSSIYEKNPGFFLMYGSYILTGIMLFYLAYQGLNNTKSTAVHYEVFMQPSQANEEDVLASLDGEIYKSFVKIGDDVEIGDTLFQLQSNSRIKSIDNLLDEINGEKVEKINWSRIKAEDFPEEIEQRIKNLENFISASRPIAYSKKTKALITTLETDLLRSQKEQESLEKSIPVFEKMLSDAQIAFDQAKEKYSNNDPSVNVSLLNALKKKVGDSEEFLRIRKRNLLEERALERNTKTILQINKNKRLPKKINKEKLSQLRDSLKIDLNIFKEQAYLLAEAKGQVSKLRDIPTFRLGDELMLIKTDLNVTPPKLYAYLPIEMWDELALNEAIQIIKVELRGKSSLESKVLSKEKIEAESFKFKAFIEVPEDFKPAEELILKAAMREDNSSNEFFQNLWSNFKI